MSERWYLKRNGRPPDHDEYTYRWNGRRWERLEEDMPPIDEDALEDWEAERRQRIAEANEY